MPSHSPTATPLRVRPRFRRDGTRRAVPREHGIRRGGGQRAEERLFLHEQPQGPARLPQRPSLIELQARFDTFALGHQVFTGGLADPNLWTSNLYAIDSGANWYLNKYTKIYFDWSHAVFGDPVLYRPSGLQKTSDLSWIRFQVYF